MNSLKVLIVLIVLAFFSFIVYGQEYERGPLNVTVYNSDLGVIKDVRKIDLKKEYQILK